MKAHLLLLAALLLSAPASFGQLSSRVSSTLVLDKPFKGANTIIIALPDSGLAAWDKTSTTLAQQGFIMKASAPPLTLATEPKVTVQAGNIAISAQVQGSNVLLRGTSSAANSASPAPIEYRGRKGKATLLAWDQLDAVAKALGGKMEYTRQK